MRLISRRIAKRTEDWLIQRRRRVRYLFFRVSRQGVDGARRFDRGHRVAGDAFLRLAAALVMVV